MKLPGAGQSVIFQGFLPERVTFFRGAFVCAAGRRIRGKTRREGKLEERRRKKAQEPVALKAAQF
jgi:hypothetical protein